jgi:hypothetical protein
MTYEEALAKASAEGAIRAYRLSDTTAYAYRLHENRYEARTLSATGGNWEFVNTLVSQKGVGRTADGWYPVVGLPHRAKPIDNDAAKGNTGYSKVSLQQCYTCKKFKPEAEFVRAAGDPGRAWECNECYTRRQKENSTYDKIGAPRKGDFLDKETLVSPPPPQTGI